MATSTYTNATALATAVELLADCGNPELLEKLAHMLSVAEKPKAKSTAPSKTQLQNAILAESLAKFMWEAGATQMTSREIVDTCGIPEILSTQKAIKLLQIGMENGWVVRQEIKSKVYWGMGSVDPR